MKNELIDGSLEDFMRKTGPWVDVMPATTFDEICYMAGPSKKGHQTVCLVARHFDRLQHDSQGL